jgi:LacI family transcriptional regulator
LIVEGDHTAEGGIAAAAQILNSPIPPTAILCSNDLTAIGVMRRSYEEGVVIPRDLSLIGFDDVRLAQYMLPPLTTVQMSQTDLALLAFKALLAEVGREEPLSNGTEYALQTNLLLRESTAMSPN